MPLIISDDMLQEAGLNERDALVEFACRMFEAGKLALWPAARLAGLGRVEMEHELMERGIPIYCPSLDEVADDLLARRALVRKNAKQEQRHRPPAEFEGRAVPFARPSTWRPTSCEPRAHH